MLKLRPASRLPILPLPTIGHNEILRRTLSPSSRQHRFAHVSCSAGSPTASPSRQGDVPVLTGTVMIICIAFGFTATGAEVLA